MSFIPQVSVLINTYNYGNFVERSIESVLEQTFPQNKIEIIVVDDGSTDDTSERVKKYGDKIKYIYKNNGGQGSAFNKGFERARGEYIILLDSDDYFFPTKVERIVCEFEKYPEVGCILNTRKIITDEDSVSESYPEFHNLKLGSDNLELIKASKYGTSRTAVRKSVLEKILPIPEQGLVIEADLYLNLAILWYGKLSCLDEELTAYRIHGSNLFSLSNYEKLPLQISSMKVALENVRKKACYSDLFDQRLLEELLKPYDIELQEKITSLNVHNGTATRKQIVDLELKKLGLGWENWGTKYKLYKLLSLPLYFLFSPEFSSKLKNYYSKNRLFNIRKKLFN